ncbi:MAG: immunity 51 family protein [Planctomycetaceae bacterium]|nr:immunity 51 family protein [Planctomycetaceae bacterium]
MYDDSIKLIEMPEHDSISVCVYNEHDGLFALGERINARHEQAYMNGYNWDALIRFYVGRKDAALMENVETDPEAGMFSAYMSHSSENLTAMKQFEAYVREMVSNDERLIASVDAHVAEIEWD